MTVLFFTSTGNSLFFAKKIGGKLISIPQTMRMGNFEFRDDAIGLVFPVYGLSVPPLILQFLEKAELQSDYIFAVLTFGTYDGGAVSQLRDAATAKSIKLSYINRLHMHENYLPGFAMEKQKNPKKQDEKLKHICEDIAARKEYISKDTWFDRFMTKTHQKSYHYLRGVGVTKKFSVTKNCIGCGICKNVCPTDNIKIIDSKPVFGKDCLSCLACTQNCPHNAIRLSTEKSDKRYRNPEVSLEEIIKANK